MKFDFSHFPDESEIIEEVNKALVDQYEYGIIVEMADRLSEFHFSGEHQGPMTVMMDMMGIELFEMVGRGAEKLRDLPETAREAIAVLWVNYMCDKPHGSIVQTIGNMIHKGLDYKRVAMDSLKQTFDQSDDYDVYNGCLIYLWTMGCVARALKRSMEDHKTEIGEIPEPHLYMGVSLN